MADLRPILALLGLSLASGCTAAAPPPPELAGLWSGGNAACDAGVGIHFTGDAIEAVYANHEREVLFADPRYEVESGDGGFRVRIIYDLPHPPGGARVVGAHGVLVLERRDGGIAPVAHTMIDGRTGAARLRVEEDPVMTALTLQPCGRHPWRERLRGLSAS